MKYEFHPFTEMFPMMPSHEIDGTFMSTKELTEKIKHLFRDAIEETTNGLLHGIPDDQLMSMAIAKRLISECFVDGVMAAWLKQEGAGYCRYFKND